MCRRWAGGSAFFGAKCEGVTFSGIETSTGPITFHCGLSDPECPQLVIAGDPHSTDVFRGYGDPSLERDPSGAP